MTPSLLLSRTLDPTDYSTLADEVDHIRTGIITEDPRHRVWEYALALHVIERWLDAGRDLHGPIYDLGPEARQWTSELEVEPRPFDEDTPLAGIPLAHVVTCFTQVCRAHDLDAYLYRLSSLVAPGGLLILTMEYWDRCGRDTAVGHDGRHRIFCPKTYGQLRTQLAGLHLTTFGGVDPSYHGRQIHDFSLASLVVEKRR